MINSLFTSWNGKRRRRRNEKEEKMKKKGYIGIDKDKDNKKNKNRREVFVVVHFIFSFLFKFLALSGKLIYAHKYIYISKFFLKIINHAALNSIPPLPLPLQSLHTHTTKNLRVLDYPSNKQIIK